MAAKSNNLIPVLLLGGLALVLVAARARRTGGVTGAPAPAATAENSDASRINAVGQIINNVLGYVGGLTSSGNHSSAPPTEAALDQVVSAAEAWQAANGATAGISGDPYNPE